MQFKTLYAALAAAALASAQEMNPNITAALGSTEDLSMLNELVGQYPELVSALETAPNITVFAPSNDALSALMESPDFATLTADPGFVAALLSYHVLNTTVPSMNITETPAFVPTLLTNETYTNVTGGQVVGARLVGENAVVISGAGARANVTQADVMIENGVVHIIDSVLMVPMNVSATALAGGLTALAGAVTATELVETLDTTPDLTIFAPVNSAFEDIGSILANLSVEDAASLLQYHVINGTVAYSSLLSNGSEIETLSGQSVNITIEEGEVFVNSARVIAADILVANGVVHLIDAVLNPNGTLTADPNNDDGVVAFPGASSGEVPYTSGIPTPTASSPIMTTDAVAENYTPAPTDALSSRSQSVADAASGTSSAGAAMVTGAVGAAALFGGAAFLAQM